MKKSKVSYEQKCKEFDLKFPSPAKRHLVGVFYSICDMIGGKNNNHKNITKYRFV